MLQILVILAKIEPIANVNRIVSANYNPSAIFFLSASLLQRVIYSFIIHRYKIRTFLLGQEIADSHRLTDSSVFSVILLQQENTR